MKKLVFSLAILAVVAIALGTTASVFAQASTPQALAPESGYGMGMGGRGARGGMTGQNAGVGTLDGFLHDSMVNVYATELGLSVDDLNSRLENGETMAQIASSKGLTVEQFNAMMVEARSQALVEAVKNGDLTQEQADWMNQRGAGMANAGRGTGGYGQGLNANADCPYYQTTP